MSRLVHLRNMCKYTSLIEIRQGRRFNIKESCSNNRANISVIVTKVSTLTTMTSNQEITRYFKVAKEITLEAGKLIKSANEENKILETKNADWDLVTNYDRAVEELLIGKLKQEFPDHKFIAEESSFNEKSVPELTDSPTWLIDPIDGTTNFVHSFPHSCISIGLTICKQLVLGIIYNPSCDEFYSAIKGQGAFFNEKRMGTSKVTDLKKALAGVELCAAFRYDSKNRDIQIGRLETLANSVQDTRNVGSAALTLAYVGRGILDCCYMGHLNSWDVAAGVLIVREAGGTVIDVKGGEYDLMNARTIAATNNDMAVALSKLIVDTDLKTQRKRLQRT